MHGSNKPIIDWIEMFLIWLTFFTELIYGFMKTSKFGDNGQSITVQAPFSQSDSGCKELSKPGRVHAV